ncbi:MAG: RdgB/HAM1 family non-canonical purine NTP pyrophosphatase [Methanobacteriota archaeon]|nr:MAG: RdgB/HAM1 family non-canonical purine NTP pyrophosphatase [Euryarchaeota archaeon]
MLFVTSNSGKFREAKEILGDVEQAELDLEEPRGSLEHIAMHKALEASKRFEAPLFVEDSGLFIDALKGFPGSLSSIVHSKIGLEGIISLMKGKEDRSAHFKSVIAYVDGDGIKLFSGAVKGVISEEIRGTGGFAYDPIFIPQGYEKTFAEDQALKTKLSHRYYSLMALKSYLQATR